jgi:hypothetical protein
MQSETGERNTDLVNTFTRPFGGSDLCEEVRMRRAVGCLLALGVVTSAFAQSSAIVEIREGRSRARIEAAGTEPYSGGPWAAVPAKPLRSDLTPATNEFRIRAWAESGQTRVVVYAVSRDDQKRETETQATTFLLSAGESRDVTETERYQAAHVFVSAEPSR